MDFHEDDQEDHEEEEEEDDEGGWMGFRAASYDNSQLADSNPNFLAEPASASAQNKPIRYKECRKNHAVGIGRHAVDGCGEFMASGADGTVDALKCAACNCHRNFHRKENYNNYPVAVFPPQQPIYRDPPPPSWYPLLVGPPDQHPRPLALPSPAVVDVQEEAGAGWNINNNLGGGGGGSGPSGIGSGSSSRKRYRTKFSQEQKERMLGLAEKLGWRIQKHDEAEVERFCNENGIKRQVLKVWMHNNKHTLGQGDWERTGSQEKTYEVASTFPLLVLG